MLILAHPIAEVKPADPASAVAFASLDRGLLETDYAEYDRWMDANAEMLESWADDAECQDRYESGCYAW